MPDQPERSIECAITQARQLIDAADSLIFTAGAGMSVDSGLPDYRGDQGFWREYGGLQATAISYEMLSTSAAFAQAPEIAWGFFGHRLNLYRATAPHQGYALLREMANAKPGGAFVITTNIDGHFEMAGFQSDRIAEIHGNVHYLQCSDTCSEAVWPANQFFPIIDDKECRLISELPKCPDCGALARPNVLMFSDWGWNEQRAHSQKRRFATWRKTVRAPILIELGAGDTIPAIRRLSERQRVPVIRINPQHDDRPSHLIKVGSIAIRLGALDALQRLTV